MDIIHLDGVTGVPAQPGLVRRVLAHSGELMLVHNTLQAGTFLPWHHHPHQQIVYVQSGEMQLHCEGQERLMRAGDSCVIPSDVPHAVTALTDTIALDTFTPARADFIQ